MMDLPPTWRPRIQWNGLSESKVYGFSRSFTKNLPLYSLQA